MHILYGFYIMPADQPNKPNNGAGHIYKNLMINSESTEALVELNWSPAENYNHTIIEYYELTLMGSHPNTTISRVYVGADQQQIESFSHMLVVPEGRNYTSASILAVDMCGQRSEPSHFEIMTGTMACSCSTLSTSTSTPAADCTLTIILASVFGGMVIILFLVAIKNHHNDIVL
jgi:hypothetical protein